MERRGTGYAHEMLVAFFFLILVVTFYASDYQLAMPAILLMAGGAMILGGMVIKEPLVVTAGVVCLAIALMYSEVFK